jgi:osmotically-inducible protein OsmY
MWNPRGLCAALALTLLPLSTAAQNAAPSAEHIRLEVIKQLQDHNLRKGKLQVTVMGSTVTIAGQVQNYWEKAEVIRLALMVKGVEMVASELTIPKAENDNAIAEQLGKGVFRYSRYTIFDDINANVKDGNVRLDGWVTDGRKAEEIGEIAAKIRGVQDLKNNLEIYPASQSDDALRREVSRRIFLDPDFEQYATLVNPPLHIVVVHGHVTLKGYLRPADRQKAEFIARGVPNVLSVENKVQVSR